MQLRLSLFAVIVLIAASIAAVSFAQRDDKPITGDFKITIKQNMGGQQMQSTTMIKGLRERSETSMNIPGMPAGMNMGQVNITQCDLKRTIQINDRARKYMIMPMDSDDTSTGASGNMGATMSSGGARGGIVTMTVNTVDTGERKEMFGFTARHLKQTMTSQSSPDACAQNNMKIERDGWYINLEYGLNCSSERPPQIGGMAPQGCRDRYQFRHTGPTNIGYPLSETTKIYGADGSVMTTMSREVVELSRQTLDAALFDVPAGYTQASSQQEMYAAPSMAEMMAMAQQQSGERPSNGENSMSAMPSAANTGAKAKVGVVEFNNKAKASVPTDELRERLIATLNGNGVEAVALNASSASEAAMEAQAKGCTYILYTDVATFKAPSSGKRIGGMLGGAVGIGGGGGKAEAKLDYRLVPAGSTSPKVQASASAKEESAEASLNAALQEEARA